MVLSLSKKGLISLIIFLIVIFCNAKEGFILTTLKEDIVSKIKVEVLYSLEDRPLSVDNSTVPGNSFFIECVENEKRLIPGMSGSPLLVDGNTIGVLSYVFGTTGRFGICTKIEKIKQEDDYMAFSSVPNSIDQSLFITEDIASANILQKRTGLKVVSLPSFDLSLKSLDSNVEPGSPVVVSLVKGDTDIGMLGTLSMVEKNRFYAFGHQVFNMGKVNYFLSKAFILGCDFENQGGFKIGIPQKTIGLVEYDGRYGIKGELEKYPLTIPFFIEYIKGDDEKDFRYRIVKDPRIFLKVFDSLVFSSSEKIFPDGCRSTIDYDLSMDVSLGDDDVYKIQINSKKIAAKIDIRSELSSQVYETINMFFENPFSGVVIHSVDLRVRIHDIDRFIPFKTYLKEDSLIVKGRIFRKGKADIEIPIEDIKDIKKLIVRTPTTYLRTDPENIEEFVFNIEESSYDIIISVEYSNGLTNEYHIRTKYIIDGEINEVIYPAMDNKDS
ncbi:MAG: hypothetical protein C0601_03950 [Candidatus Muiribacterium halophilum]|uniref:Peptidase S55 domain-containing protein n=1 Tax=Muiribacterium halophilum TaxID=2053465 RepID=A0A2N5ZJC3_MUIH1|nr:MAG: hypothetical protein C0601_03950 [Candidatus Muirbacterium halophilum]